MVVTMLAACREDAGHPAHLLDPGLICKTKLRLNGFRVCGRYSMGNAVVSPDKLKRFIVKTILEPVIHDQIDEIP